jgi:hypothetical protein
MRSYCCATLYSQVWGDSSGHMHTGVNCDTCTPYWQTAEWGTKGYNPNPLQQVRHGGCAH